MTDSGLVQPLVRLGLTQYEARAYVALVRRDGSTPAEVAKVAGVPRPRIYDVLESLVVRGFVSNRPGGAAKFVAAPPSDVVAALMAGHQERLQGLQVDAAEIEEQLQPAYLAGSRLSDPLDYIEVLRSPDAIRKRYRELEGAVEHEMLGFSKMPAVVRVEENDAGLEVARRCRLRSLYEFSLLDDPISRDGVARFVAAGEQARFVDELPMKLCIIDQRIVLLVMADPVAGDAGLTTLIIENAQLACCLKIVFEQQWSIGVPFEQACALRVGTPAR